MPAIPYLVPEFVSVVAQNSVPHSRVHFPLFLLGFAHSRIFRPFRVFRLFRFSRVQIRNSGFPFFPLFLPFPVFKGPNPEFRFFLFFSPLLGVPNPEFRDHGSGHVWCGHVWCAPIMPVNGCYFVTCRWLRAGSQNYVTKKVASWTYTPPPWAPSFFFLFLGLRTDREGRGATVVVHNSFLPCSRAREWCTNKDQTQAFAV